MKEKNDVFKVQVYKGLFEYKTTLGLPIKLLFTMVSFSIFSFLIIKSFLVFIPFATFAYIIKLSMKKDLIIFDLYLNSLSLSDILIG